MKIYETPDMSKFFYETDVICVSTPSDDPWGVDIYD